MTEVEIRGGVEIGPAQACSGPSTRGRRGGRNRPRTTPTRAGALRLVFFDGAALVTSVYALPNASIQQRDDSSMGEIVAVPPFPDLVQPQVEQSPKGQLFDVAVTEEHVRTPAMPPLRFDHRGVRIIWW